MALDQTLGSLGLALCSHGTGCGTPISTPQLGRAQPTTPQSPGDPSLHLAAGSLEPEQLWPPPRQPGQARGILEVELGQVPFWPPTSFIFGKQTAPSLLPLSSDNEAEQWLLSRQVARVKDHTEVILGEEKASFGTSTRQRDCCRLLKFTTSGGPPAWLAGLYVCIFLMQ